MYRAVSAAKMQLSTADAAAFSFHAAGVDIERTIRRADFETWIAPELAETHYGEEMWSLYEKGELKPDTALTGRFVFDQRRADVHSVMRTIDEARKEALIRDQGRKEAAERD